MPFINPGQCQYCQDLYTNEASLGLHYQGCENWKRTLEGYNLLKRKNPKPISKKEKREINGNPQGAERENRTRNH